MIDCKINQINFVPLATNWFNARGEGGDYQNIATSILRSLWLSHSSAARNTLDIYVCTYSQRYKETLKEQCKIASISWNEGFLITCLLSRYYHYHYVLGTRGRGFLQKMKKRMNQRQTNYRQNLDQAAVGGCHSL